MLLDLLISEWPRLVAIAAILACSALFAGAETAFFSLSRKDQKKLDRLSDLLSRRANRLRRTLCRKPGRGRPRASYLSGYFESNAAASSRPLRINRAHRRMAPISHPSAMRPSTFSDSMSTNSNITGSRRCGLCGAKDVTETVGCTRGQASYESDSMYFLIPANVSRQP